MIAAVTILTVCVLVGLSAATVAHIFNQTLEGLFQ